MLCYMLALCKTQSAKMVVHHLNAVCSLKGNKIGPSLQSGDEGDEKELQDAIGTCHKGI